MKKIELACAAAVTAGFVLGGAVAQPQPNEPGGKPKAAAPAEKPKDGGKPAHADPGATPTTIAGVTFDAPSAFQKMDIKPGGMRVAQFTVHAPDDSNLENGEVVFYYFGPQGAGTVEANVTRWSSQVTDAGGKAVEPRLRVVDRKPLKITEASFEGTYESGMPGGEKMAKKDFGLIGAIVEGGPDGMVVARFTGPKMVVEKNRPMWNAMLESMRASAK